MGSWQLQVWSILLLMSACACGAQRSDAASTAQAGSTSAAAAGQSSSISAGASGQSCPVSQAEPCTVPDSGAPTDVFCTGLYRNRDATQYAPDAKPYTPGVTLWSDGADKQRYLYLPPGSAIDTSNMDVWSFPVGTKAWKEFRFDGKLVETRFFWKRDAMTWETGTYIWSADQKAASLNTSRTPTLLASGYEIPTAKDCGKCHHGAADKLLGVEAVALALSSARGLTLERLTADGSLSAPPAILQIELPTDDTGLAGGALGYLHANCGMPCHSSRGLGHETELLMRLRADEYWKAGTAGATPAASSTESYRAMVNQSAVTGAVTSAFPDALRITPGQHELSLVWLLSHRRGDYQMPPLVSHKVDEDGAQRLANWIDALPPAQH